jgi:intraflagellar transport protein 88
VKNDELREELRRKQNQAQKYILTAARLIAPVLGGTCMEGYDWVVELLKDQQYVALANEMEMDRAIQHLHKQDFGQVLHSDKERNTEIRNAWRNSRAAEENSVLVCTNFTEMWIVVVTFITMSEQAMNKKSFEIIT